MGSPIGARSSAGRVEVYRTDDLGSSGGGVSRPGFETLLAAMLWGIRGDARIEVSRLGAQWPRWHPRMMFCGLGRPPSLSMRPGSYDPSQSK